MGTERTVAVITRASQGIRAALVKAYRDRNYRVVATARAVEPSHDADILFRVRRHRRSEDGRACDLRRRGPVRAHRHARQHAGFFIAKPFTHYTEADYAAIVRVNVTGFFHMTQLAIAAMEKQGFGHVVQITTSLV